MTDTMRMSHDERRSYYERVQALKLKARVNCVNQANALAMQLHGVLANIFGGYVGCQILKVDGDLIKRVDDAVPKFNTSPSSWVRLSYTSYTLGFYVQVSECHEGGNAQHETYVCLGTIRNRVLQDIKSEPPVFRTDYTAEEIILKRAEYERLKNLTDEAQSKLEPFGERD